jgi:hypothetical protein
MRVKSIVNGITTAHVGSHYEKNITTSGVTKYYTFGGQRVAMRKGSTLNWQHSDHLGSASLATNASGGAVPNSEQRYTPFGSLRLNASGLPKAIYVDNGQVFHAVQFGAACASLNIKKLHSQPYQPEGRGKNLS